MTDFKSFFTESVTSCKNCVIVGTFLRTKKHKILYFSEILICRRNVTVLSYPNAYCKKEPPHDPERSAGAYGGETKMRMKLTRTNYDAFFFIGVCCPHSLCCADSQKNE